MRLSIQRRDRHAAHLRTGAVSNARRRRHNRTVDKLTAALRAELSAPPSTLPVGDGQIHHIDQLVIVGPTISHAPEENPVFAENVSKVKAALAKGPTFRSYASRLANLFGFTGNERSSLGLPTHSR